MTYIDRIREFFVQTVGWGEIAAALLVAVLTYGALIVVLHIFHRAIRKQGERRDSVWLYVLQEAITRIKKWSLAVVAVYAGVQMLEVSSFLARAADIALLITLVIQGALVLAATLDDVLMIQFGREGDETRRSALGIISRIGAGLIWALAFLFALSNLGVNTNSLIAGLGVGGIAIAFALQGILSDLLSAFTVFFDRPFEVGDFIGFQGKYGTVKRVGIMTTRIELMSGEELVVTNQDLTTNMLENYTRLEERRVEFTFGTVYELSAETVASIPETVRDIIEPIENTRFGRTHFKEFGDHALIFEVVYFVKVPDYEVYMEIQQKINLEIMRRFEERGITLAYPTQTIHLKQAS